MSRSPSAFMSSCLEHDEEHHGKFFVFVVVRSVRRAPELLRSEGEKSLTALSNQLKRPVLYQDEHAQQNEYDRSGNVAIAVDCFCGYRVAGQIPCNRTPPC